MTPTNFCYWLQGFFELASPGGLTDAQVVTIQNHLAMTDITRSPAWEAPSGKMAPTEFCQWLKGFLAVVTMKETLREGLNFTATQKLRETLNDVFLHSIDPSFPAHQQEALNKAHNGGRSSGDLEVMC